MFIHLFISIIEQSFLPQKHKLPVMFRRVSTVDVFFLQEQPRSEADSDSGRTVGDSGYLTEEGQRRASSSSHQGPLAQDNTISYSNIILNSSQSNHTNSNSQSSSSRNSVTGDSYRDQQTKRSSLSSSRDQLSQQQQQQHFNHIPRSSNNNLSSSCAPTRSPHSSYAFIAVTHEQEDRDVMEDCEERRELLVDDLLLLGPRRRSLSPAMLEKRGKSPSGSCSSKSSRRIPVVV